MDHIRVELDADDEADISQGHSSRLSPNRSQNASGTTRRSFPDNRESSATNSNIGRTESPTLYIAMPIFERKREAFGSRARCIMRIRAMQSDWRAQQTVLSEEQCCKVRQRELSEADRFKVTHKVPSEAN